MGDIADMMLDGTLCQTCGEVLDDDLGVPTFCAGCKPPGYDVKPTKRKKAKARAHRKPIPNRGRKP